jgi:hypothetical protein
VTHKPPRSLTGITHCDLTASPTTETIARNHPLLPPVEDMQLPYKRTGTAARGTSVLLPNPSPIHLSHLSRDSPRKPINIIRPCHTIDRDDGSKHPLQPQPRQPRDPQSRPRHSLPPRHHCQSQVGDNYSLHTPPLPHFLPTLTAQRTPKTTLPFPL